MSARNFPTAQDAENAFYEALERCDLEGMMAVWAEDEDIVCVHPAGPRLTGQDQIRESWARIFSGGPRARVHITNQVPISGMMLAVHSVHENFTIEGQSRGDAHPVPVVATNDRHGVSVAARLPFDGEVLVHAVHREHHAADRHLVGDMNARARAAREDARPALADLVLSGKPRPRGMHAD